MLLSRNPINFTYHNHVFECFFLTFAFVNNVLLFIEVCNDNGQSPAFLLSNKWNHKSILSFGSSTEVCVLYFPQIANTFHIMNIKTDFFSRIILIVEMNLEKENVICAA